MAAKFQLHLITEPRGDFAGLVVALRRAAEGGVTWVQLRDKQASQRVLFQQATELREVLAATGTPLSVNDRLDVALAASAAGVHLSAQGLPVAAAGQIARHLVLGRSVHGLDEACEAAVAGADYLTFGHVFPTHSKEGLPPRGVVELAAIVAAVDVPVLAIGGITYDNVEQVLATGCAGVAVISAILSESDPRAAAAALRDRLEQSPSWPRRPFPEAMWEEQDLAFDRESTAV
ncbi:MAG TPA: thiamine phosphate synthase [Chloroflexota bacterium]|nr:thiamine phosphate synthase [Chloroflexota bacterium]